MQLFRVEGFETEGKFMPRATQIAGSLISVYLGITAVCAVSYYLAGMSIFDALVHSMTTIATGGFSNHNASIAYFSSLTIEVLCIIFMVAGSLPFLLYLKEMRGGRGALMKDSQVRWFFGTAAIFILLALIAYQPSQPEPLGPRLITVVFNVISMPV